MQELLENKDLNFVEWSQTNKENGDGFTDVEVTFKYKVKTPVKE